MLEHSADRMADKRDCGRCRARPSARGCSRRAAGRCTGSAPAWSICRTRSDRERSRDSRARLKPRWCPARSPRRNSCRATARRGLAIRGRRWLHVHIGHLQGLALRGEGEVRHWPRIFEALQLRPVGCSSSVGSRPGRKRGWRRPKPEQSEETVAQRMSRSFLRLSRHFHWGAARNRHVAHRARFPSRCRVVSSEAKRVQVPAGMGRQSLGPC